MHRLGEYLINTAIIITIPIWGPFAAIYGFLFVWLPRTYKRVKALKSGPKFHLGDVVDVDNQYAREVKGEAVLAIKFVHRSGYKNQELYNEYRYLLNNDWYPGYVMKKVPIQDEMEY